MNVITYRQSHKSKNAEDIIEKFASTIYTLLQLLCLVIFRRICYWIRKMAIEIFNAETLYWLLIFHVYRIRYALIVNNPMPARIHFWLSINEKLFKRNASLNFTQNIPACILNFDQSWRKNFFSFKLTKVVRVIKVVIRKWDVKNGNECMIKIGSSAHNAKLCNAQEMFNPP